MCNTSTTYYTLCKCYGKLVIHGEPCVRATSRPNSPTHCGSTNNLGVQSINAMCPRCTKSDAVVTECKSTSGLLRAESFSANIPRRKGEETTKGSTSMDDAGLEKMSAAIARRRKQENSLSSLLKSVKAAQSCRPGVSTTKIEPSRPRRVAGQTNEKSQKMTNLHWRMFDNRGYGEMQGEEAVHDDSTHTEVMPAKAI